jgi:hypothetical protein
VGADAKARATKQLSDFVKVRGHTKACSTDSTNPT